MFLVLFEKLQVFISKQEIKTTDDMKNREDNQELKLSILEQIMNYLFEDAADDNN